MRELLIKLGLVKQTPRMYYRLDNLVKYFKILDINSERIKVEETEIEEYYSYISLKFYSKLGATEIHLSKSINEFPGDYVKIEYITYAGTLLFMLKATESSVYVEPCMGYEFNVGAREIDLAILELEEYLKNEYGDIEVLEEGYLTAERLAKESHEEQIKYLEKP